MRLGVDMSPLEGMVLIGIVTVFTVFAVILAWVSRADGNVSPAPDAVPDELTVQMHSADCHDRLRQASLA